MKSKQTYLQFAYIAYAYTHKTKTYNGLQVYTSSNILHYNAFSIIEVNCLTDKLFKKVHFMQDH